MHSADITDEIPYRWNGVTLKKGFATERSSCEACKVFNAHNIGTGHIDSLEPSQPQGLVKDGYQIVYVDRIGARLAVIVQSDRLAGAHFLNDRRNHPLNLTWSIRCKKAQIYHRKIIFIAVQDRFGKLLGGCIKIGGVKRLVFPMMFCSEGVYISGRRHNK